MNGGGLLLMLSFALAGAPPTRAERGKLLDGATINFAVGSSTIGEPSSPALDRAAIELKRRAPTDNVLLVGHTDDQGDSAANRKLSLARAATVREALIERGVDGDMLAVIGVGDTEPIDPAPTEPAREKNRRVEAWLVAQRAAAHVTWIRKRVDAKDPRLDWAPAELDMALMRRYEVRALQDSAGEVTFREQGKLYLGSGSLVVIYESAQASTRARSRATEVTVEEGDVFARLAKKEAPIPLKTPHAQVELRAGLARVTFSKTTASTGVAVYDGRAQVSAKGRSVDVPKNYGTRVKKDKPPEPPAPLPAPPDWLTTGIVLVHGGSASPLKWELTDTSTIEAQIAAAGDPEFERPTRRMTIEGETTALAGLDAGAYWIRLASVDERGLVGPAGPSLKLVVLPPPMWLGRVPAEVNRAAVRLPGPGRMMQPAPPGMRVVLGASREPAAGDEGLAFPLPGRFGVPWRLELEGGATFAGGSFSVEVGQVAMLLDPPQPEVEGDVSRAKIAFRVVGRGDQPIGGLRFRLQRVDERIPELPPFAATGDDGSPSRAVLYRCDKCSPPETSLVVAEESEGRYSVVYERPVQETYESDYVRLVEDETKLVQEIEVPIGATAYTPDSGPKSGFLGTVRMGVQIGDQGTAAYRADLEAGWRFHLFGPLSLDGTVVASFYRTQFRTISLTETTNIFPVQGKVSAVCDFGGFGIHAGGQGGAGLVAGPHTGSGGEELRRVQPLFGGHLGGFVVAGVGEIVAEVHLGPPKHSGEDAKANLGPSITVGYRWQPWREGNSRPPQRRFSGDPAATVAPHR